MREILVTASVLVLTAFMFNGCINQPPSQPGTNQTGTITELKPAVAVPVECHTTPIYLGHNTAIAGLGEVPWLNAEPPSSGIIAYLFFAGPEASRNQAYQPLHTGGRYLDGRSTKFSGSLTPPMHPTPLRSLERRSPPLTRRSDKASRWLQVLLVTTRLL